MPPIRFLMRCDQRLHVPRPADSGSRGPVRGGVVLEIRPLRGDRDIAAASELAAQCRAGDPALAGRWSPAGLRAELASREGRWVQGWLAWPAGEGRSVAPSVAAPALALPAVSGHEVPQLKRRCPLGMVVVVDVGRKPLVRASIAWLLVHPATRRRGVATALVRRALAEVGCLGGDDVTAETLSSWPAATAFWKRFADEQEPAPQSTGADHG